MGGERGKWTYEWQGGSKTIFIQSWYECICAKLQIIYKYTTRSNNWI